jgi:methylmalonyl-CoA mutase N-terminal domain/subunit
MYRDRLWTMRQYAGYASAQESNRRYRFLLSQGTTGLSVAFDLPTQIGYDSDHSLVRGEVGTASTLLALYLAVAEERGTAWTDLGGTVQNDILKEYIARGTYIYPPKQSLRLVTDILEFCADHVPRWNTISISGYHIREAGSTAIQEIAFTLANALCYVDAAIDRGLDVDRFASRLSFFFNSHNNFLEEVAKFRAARRLWAELMKEKYAPKSERALWLRFHTQTAGSTLTAQQPDNNVVRVALQALAAICGGTQSLHTNSRDEALGLPTEEAAQLALRTQQVLACESGIAAVPDPLGGSYAIESLTAEIASKARNYIEHIDQLGGALAAIEAGFQQREIADAAYSFQRKVEQGKEKIVGVNIHESEQEKGPPVLTVDPATEQQQVARLREFRARRDERASRSALDDLRRAAESEHENLIPSIISAVRANATLGEVSDCLRAVFGEYRPAE